MSNTSIMSIRDMIDDAFGEPEKNVVDHKLIETILFLLARQLQMPERRVKIEIGIEPYEGSGTSLSITELKIHAMQKTKKKPTKPGEKDKEEGPSTGQEAQKHTGQALSTETGGKKDSSGKDYPARVTTGKPGAAQEYPTQDTTEKPAPIISDDAVSAKGSPGKTLTENTHSDSVLGRSSVDTAPTHVKSDTYSDKPTTDKTVIKKPSSFSKLAQKTSSDNTAQALTSQEPLLGKPSVDKILAPVTSTDKISTVITSKDVTTSDKTKPEKTTSDITSTDITTSSDKTSTDKTSPDKTGRPSIDETASPMDKTSIGKPLSDKITTDKTTEKAASTIYSTEKASTGKSVYQESTEKMPSYKTSDKTSSYKSSTDYKSSSYKTSTDITSTDVVSSEKASYDKDRASKSSSSGKGKSRKIPTTDMNAPAKRKQAESFKKPGKTRKASLDSVEPKFEKLLVVERVPTEEAKARAAKSGTGSQRASQLSLVTKEEFDELAEMVRRLKKRTAQIPAPGFPDNAQLMEDLRKSASLTDAMSALQLSARLEVTEKTLEEMLSIVNDLANKSSRINLTASSDGTNVLFGPKALLDIGDGMDARVGAGTGASLGAGAGARADAGAAVGADTGPRSKTGKGAVAGPYAKSGKGADAGLDAKTGKGADAGPDAKTGKGVDAGPGAKMGKGSDAGLDAITGKGAGTSPGVEAGAGPGQGAGAGTGAEAGPGAGARQGTGDSEDGGADADSSLDAGAGAGADFGGRAGAGSRASSEALGEDTTHAKDTKTVSPTREKSPPSQILQLTPKTESTLPKAEQAHPKDTDGKERKRDCVTYIELDNAMQNLYDELISKVTGITSRSTTTANNALKLAESLDGTLDSAFNLGNQMNDLEDLIAQYADQINRLDTGLSEQMTNYQEQLTQMQHDLETGLETMAELLANTGGDPAAVAELNMHFNNLQTEFDTMIYFQKDLKFNQKSVSLDFEGLWKLMELLRSMKSDRDEVADALHDKVGIQALNGFVTLQQFEAICGDLEKNIGAAHNDFNNQEIVWQKAIDEVLRELNEKADSKQILSLKDEINKHINNLLGKISAMNEILGERRAACLNKHLHQDTACLSCCTPAHVNLKEPVKVAALPRLQGARQPAIGAEATRRPKGDGDYGGLCYRGLPIPHPRDPRSRVCLRYCGGSHTLLTNTICRVPPGITTKPTLRSISTGPGTDGKMYMLDESAKKVPCLPCNVSKTTMLRPLIKTQEPIPSDNVSDMTPADFGLASPLAMLTSEDNITGTLPPPIEDI